LPQQIFSREYHHEHLLEKLKLQTLLMRRHHSDVLFITNVYNHAKCWISVLQAVGIHVPALNIRNISMLTCSSSHSPSSGGGYGAHTICKLIYVFRKCYLNVKKNLTNSVSLVSLLCPCPCFIVDVLYSFLLCNWPSVAELSR
jgi:hypothetical protein